MRLTYAIIDHVGDGEVVWLSVSWIEIYVISKYPICMTRYPDQEERYIYYCEECGKQIQMFQGVFWFTRERQRDGETVDVPYCPDCGSESIHFDRD